MVHSAIWKEKQKNENMTLVDAGNVLKFLVEKNTLRDELKFQLTNISGNNKWLIIATFVFLLWQDH